MGPSSVLTGGLSGAVWTWLVQPGASSGSTPSTGWSDGKKICTLTVSAAASSLGTRKPRVISAPFGALLGSTVTCAQAGGANASTVNPVDTPRQTLKRC